jgi:hypothetical protein
VLPPAMLMHRDGYKTADHALPGIAIPDQTVH